MCKLHWAGEVRDDIAITISDVTDAYAVYNNTDLTEGRGWTIPQHICKLRATAHRKASGAGVQGSDAEVRRVKLLKIGSDWYGPVHVHGPTAADEASEKQLIARQQLVDKALELGLTMEDINALRNN